MWHKPAFGRSIAPVDEPPRPLVIAGYPDREDRPATHPFFGSVVSKLRGQGHANVPPFVSLRGMSRGTEPGFLGIAHRPFAPSGQASSNLRMPGGVNIDRLNERKDLLTGMDDLKRDIDASGTMAGMDVFNQKAIEM